jgi:hypothetical protein
MTPRNLHKNNPTNTPRSEDKEKASIGGQYNSGVTSEDADEKDQIEKKGSMYDKQPKSCDEKEESDRDNQDQ